MALRGTLLKIAGKKDFNLDPNIPNSYIIRLCWKYGWMMVHGKACSLGNNTISNDVFVGYKVKLIRKKQMHIGSKTKIYDYVRINALSTNDITIGDQCVIGERSVLEATGGLECIGKGIVIGNRTTFGSDCFFGAAGGIEIGHDVIAGQYIRFHSENHNFDNVTTNIREQGVTHKGIKIGNNCWIGSGAVFLDGAELGDGCVVAANAVVTKSFPENTIVGGVPAKALRKRGKCKYI